MTFLPANAQEDIELDKQLWIFGFFNWKLNERWIYSQDFGYMHLYNTPTFTRIFIRSQTGRQITGSFSLHGGLNFLVKFHEELENTIEIRPWVGTKLRWPYFWRFDFVQYMRLEERFEKLIGGNDWDYNIRVRYKISSSVPINHFSLTDKTIYGIIGYEIYSGSFGADVRLSRAVTHRFEMGLGYRHNVKHSFEALVILFNTKNDDTDKFLFSSSVLFLKYKRYINWE